MLTLIKFFFLFFILGMIFVVGFYLLKANNCQKAQWQNWSLPFRQLISGWVLTEPELNATIDYTHAPQLLAKAKEQGIQNYRINPHSEAQSVWKDAVVVPLLKAQAARTQLTALSTCNGQVVFFDLPTDKVPATTVEIHDLADLETDLATLQQLFPETDLNQNIFQLTTDFKLVRVSPDNKHLVVRLYQDENADIYSTTQTDLLMRSLFFGLADTNVSENSYAGKDNLLYGAYFISDKELKEYEKQ